MLRNINNTDSPLAEVVVGGVHALVSGNIEHIFAFIASQSCSMRVTSISFIAYFFFPVWFLKVILPLP